MLLLADTNVLLRIVERGHAQHATAVEAIEIFDASGHELVIVPQVVYEFWAVATRPVVANGLGMNAAETQTEFNGLLRQFRILRDERAILEIWQQLVMDHDVKGKQVHDARLVAAMIRHRVSHLLTFNAADFARFREITAVKPSQAGAFEAAN